jgi:hypothetical protein
MAKFSQEFLRQMANPVFGQGMFTAAKQAAQLPGQLQQQQMQQQQMQALRSMTPMQRAQYAMQTAKTPAQITAAQTQMDAAQERMAEIKKAEANAELNKLYQQYITETDPEKIASLESRIRSMATAAGRDVTAVENQLQAVRSRKKTQATNEQFETFFDKYVPDDRKEEYRGLTQAQILNRLDQDADVEEAREWAKWLSKNKITDSNRQKAIDLAVKAFGSKAAAEVARAEASQLSKEKDSKADRKRTLLVTYQGRQDPMLAAMGQPAPTAKPTKLDIYLDKDGNVPERILNMLNDTAISAVGQDFEFVWSPKKVPERDVQPTQPTNGVPTLNQLMGR